MEINQTIRLVAKTKFGKERIKRDGDTFVVLEIRDNVACLSSRGAMIAPPNGNSRWIALPIDRDFEIKKSES
jgi:hypothetical protein